MFRIPWYAILLMTIPQIFLAVKLGMRLFNLEINKQKCLWIAFIGGYALYYLRILDITPGIHTVLTALVVTLLVTVLNKTNIGYAFVSVLLGFLILGVIEGAWLPFLLRLTSSSISDLALHPWLNIFGFYPILSVATIIYFLAKYKKFVLFDLQRLGPTHEKE